MTARICRTEELPEGAVRREVVDGRHIAVARHRGVVHGFSAICPHQRHDLADGFIADDGITCGSHLWHFRFSDGGCGLIPGASIPLFPARDEDGWVVVDLAGGA
jgi:nitrite reductase/ring-hydroxylating ferredoxin subunit